MSQSEQNDSYRTDNHEAIHALENVALKSLEEQRKARRWGVFFKLLTFAYLAAVTIALVVGSARTGLMGAAEEHVAVIDVDGVIAADEQANANAIASALRRAFDNENAAAILLNINSPGGSPVQAGKVYDEIKRLRALHTDKKVYASIAEIGASGAYYIAVAADEIYADKASLVGSIGVVGSGFGFVETLEKLGVERRQYTAGEHKAFLDPFAPENPQQVEFWGGVLKVTHDQFVNVVREGRGERLADDPTLFSGLIWTGEQAVDLGLLDGLASPGSIARDLVGVEEMVDYTVRPDPLQQALSRLGAQIGAGIVAASRAELTYPELR